MYFDYLFILSLEHVFGVYVLELCIFETNVSVAFYGNSILRNKIPTNKQTLPDSIWMVITFHLQLPPKVHLVSLFGSW